ncbi:hypothetical protein [Halosimplex salinum]|uniref:hypothetical protein n=1 Tax=Halosimplex salinum TaxID=1710538 RepID=UPI000F48BBEE|nr:hypothetical protein [Halosimplex salinum]
MSLSDPSRPDEPHWIPLGVNEVRINDGGGMISIPKELIDAGILQENKLGDSTEHYGYWSYERENGWILLGNEALTNNENRVTDIASDGGVYETDDTDGDFKFAKRYKLRQDGRLQIPDRFFSPVADIESAQDTTEQVVPEQAAMTEGEQRFFMTWSEWLKSDPKVAVLFRMDHLPFKSPDQVPGTGGTTPGPRFGGGDGTFEEPDIGLSN